MRLWLGLILAFFVGGAQAHAAFAVFQTYAGPPQIFYNIVSDGGAACNGDVQTVTRTASITSGTKNLAVTVNTFSSGDVGKQINIEGAGNSGGRYFGKIATFTDAQNVVLDTNASTTLSAVSTTIYFGTTDNVAFDTFNNWARANQGASNQVVLTIPNGSNCWFGNGTFNYISVFNAFAAGVKNLIVEGTGAIINSVGGRSFQLGQEGICPYGLADTNGCSARLQTVNPGDTTVTLTADSLSAGYLSRFPNGQWTMIGGLNTQANFQSGGGSPPNMTFFEWRQVVSSNAGTGVITLDRPLTKFYSSAWPSFTIGGAFEQDSGGPATIWTVGNSGAGGAQNSWNATAEYRGLTISQEGQTYARGRSTTYRNVTFTGNHGGIPTQNETFSAINTDYGSTNMETDKLVGTMLMDGVTIRKIVNQSTSTERFIMRNSNVTENLVGGAQYTEITDSTLAEFGPGIFAYGSTGTSNQTICTRCNIGILGFAMNYNSGTDSFWSKSGGTITMPNAGAQGSSPGQRYFVPGARVVYVGGTTNPPTNPLFACCESLGSFLVGTITSDPWPALDNQTSATNVTIPTAGNAKRLTVAASVFASGDVGKTIIVPGAGNSGGDLRTWITGFNSATDVVLYNAATTSLVASSKTVQWGTSNTYIATNQSGAFPDVSAFSSNVPGIGFKVVGSWNFTCDACTGDPNAVGASIQAGATPSKPLGTYITRTYSPASAAGSLGVLPGRGVFQSLRINVTAAATAAGSVVLNPGGQFHWYMIDRNTPTAPDISDWLPANFAINLKQTGDRVITPSGVTCDGSPGACSGDTITPPANLATMWLMQGAMTPYMGSTHTGAPAFTITLQTDPVQ